MVFFTEEEQKFSQFVWKQKRPKIARGILRKKNRRIAQGTRLESPEINPYIHGHLIYDKGGKNIQWRKDNPSKQWC